MDDKFALRAKNYLFLFCKNIEVILKNWGLTTLKGTPRGFAPPPRKFFYPPLPIGRGYSTL